MNFRRTHRDDGNRESRLDGTIWETLITRRNVALVMAVLFGGGGIAAWDVATKDDVKTAVSESLATTRAESDTRFEKISSTVTVQGEDISAIQRQVGNIQHVQQRQIARQEARRLTSDIKDRRERETAYDRLLDLNLARLRENRDPCQTVFCNH